MVPVEPAKMVAEPGSGSIPALPRAEKVGSGLMLILRWSRYTLTACSSSLFVLCAIVLTAPAGLAALDASGSTEGGAGVPFLPIHTSLLVRYDPATCTLDVRAEQAEIGDILRVAARQAGIGIVVEQGVSGRVTISFSGLTIEEGIQRIAEEAGFGDLAMEYARVPGVDGSAIYRIEKCSVFGRASSAHISIRQKTGTDDKVRAGSRTVPPGHTPRETRNTATVQELSGKERPFSLKTAGGVPERGSTRQTNAPARRSAEKVRSSTIEREGTPVQSPANSVKAGRGTGAAIQRRTNQFRDGGAASLSGSGREEQVLSLMRDAQREDIPAIELLGKMGARQAAPLLERIVSRSPEGSPAGRAASEALLQMEAARRIQ